MTSRELIIVSFLLVSIVFLYSVLLTISNNIDVQYVRFDKILAKTMSLKQNNLIIEDEVLENESLTLIASKAASMGFVPQNSNSLIYLP
jgi:cell division protein FtsL